LGKPEIPLLTGFGQGFLYSGIALLFPETATTDMITTSLKILMALKSLDG
jgi:hypothetical protein